MMGFDENRFNDLQWSQRKTKCLLLSEIHCHGALSAGTSKVTVWLIIKAGNSNTCPREERWGTGSPRFSALSSRALGFILFEDYSLARSLIMQHRQVQLANLTASLKCCPKPGTPNLRRNDLEFLLHDKQACFSVSPHPTQYIHLRNAALSSLMSPSWVTSVLIKQHQLSIL